MAATTPLWVTVLLAVLTPVLTLAGVLWTQRASDRRAIREAELRLRAQREEHLADRRFQTYTLVVSLLDEKQAHMSSRAWRSKVSPDRENLNADYIDILSRLVDAMIHLTIVGNQETIVLAVKADEELRDVVEGEGLFEAVGDDFYEYRRQLIRAIRKDWGTAEELNWEELAARR